MTIKKSQQQVRVLDGELDMQPSQFRALVDARNSGLHLGKRRKHPLREQMVPDDLVGFDPTNPASIRRLAENPVAIAQLMADSRRPAGVNRRQFGIALRRNEPMVNADPRTTQEGLNTTRQAVRARIPVGLIVNHIRVKPLTLKNARVGRETGSFWGERLWKIAQPKYGKGFCVVTDTGDTSTMFPSYSECINAVRKSGWEIIK